MRLTAFCEDIRDARAIRQANFRSFERRNRDFSATFFISRTKKCRVGPETRSVNTFFTFPASIFRTWPARQGGLEYLGGRTGGKTESGRADKGQSRDSEEIGGMHETGVGTDDDMGTVNEVAGFQ